MCFAYMYASALSLNGLRQTIDYLSTLKIESHLFTTCRAMPEKLGDGSACREKMGLNFECGLNIKAKIEGSALQYTYTPQP